MSERGPGDGIPTEEQLARIERRVLGRIDRRAGLWSAAKAASVVVLLVLGGIALLIPLRGLGGAASGSSGAAGSAAGGSSAARSSALVVRCHTSSTAASPAKAVPLPGAATPAAAVAACTRAGLERPQAAHATPPHTGSGAAASNPDPVVCRDPRKQLHVFPPDASPATLCRRNGMSVP